MKDKACDNIKAAKLLLKNGFFNSTASRSYYAAYLIAWYLLGEIGFYPPHKTKKGQYYWRHDLFPQIMCDDKLLTPDQVDEWEWIYYLRIKADYYIENVEEEEAKQTVEVAGNFIDYFSNEERFI